MRVMITMILVITLSSLYSQKTDYLCKYAISSQRDSMNRNSVFKDTMYLVINKDSSVYYSHLFQVGRRRAEEDDGKPLEYFMEQQAKNWYYPLCEKEIITHYYREKRRKVLIQYKNKYVYAEAYTSPEWKILHETKLINGLKCEKATTLYKGRNYVAWFTRSVPSKQGPWEFNDLPGLILYISDTQEHFVFECVELVKHGEDPVYRTYSDLKESTKQKVEELKKLWLTDMISFDAVEWNSPSYSVNPDGSLTPSRSKIQPFNPIDRTWKY